MANIEEVDFTQSVAARWIAAGMLLVAPIFDWPYGYYTILRWVVTLTAAWLVALTWSHPTKWKLLFVGIAILFNPISPIYLDATIWAVLDVASAVLLAVSTYFISNRIHQRARGPEG